MTYIFSLIYAFPLCLLVAQDKQLLKKDVCQMAKTLKEKDN